MSLFFSQKLNLLLGTGEQIIKTLFAKELYEKIKQNDDRSLEISDFLCSTIEKFNGSGTAIGFIALVEDSYGYEFWFGHTTDSLGLAYMTGLCDEPKSEISRKINGTPFKLSCNLFRKQAL